MDALHSTETSIAPTDDRCDDNIKTARRHLRWTQLSFRNKELQHNRTAKPSGRPTVEEEEEEMCL